MKLKVEKNIDLPLAFNRFFLESEHAFCLWDEEKQQIITANPAFKAALEHLPINDKLFLTDDLIINHQSRINKILIEKSKYLLECDKLFFQELGKSTNDYEELKEEKMHANVQAEELGIKLDQSQRQFQKIAQIAPTGIIFTDTNFKITWSNNKGFQLFGSNDIIEKSLGDLIYVKEILEFYENLEKLKNSDQPVLLKFTIHNIADKKDYFIKCYGVSFIGYNLQKTFVFILEDHTENIHYSEEITNRNLELTQINNELDKFLYSVSHNIRGPVSSLQGLLNVIDISDVKTVNELKHHLRLNLRLLDSFVEDITNVAENIHVNLKSENVKLLTLLENNISFFANLYKLSPEVTLDFPNDYTIKTDPNRLSIILKNILKNSFQYQDKDKAKFKLKIKAELLRDYHFIEIWDNGLGIQEEVLPKIFEMFYRGNELSSGNGMGLYNSRVILKNIGGRINIESQNSAFTLVKIYLPINPD